MSPASPEPEISLVVPVFDEEENLRPLHAEIARALAETGRPWEVLYVDDRSTDDSPAVLRELRAGDPHVRVVRFRRNFGQTAAMAAGFEHARGELVITLDADLQNDPADIPRLLAELERGEGADVVVGWRKARQDGFLLRRLPSILANRMIAYSTGVHIHDTGCTLKVFRRAVIDNLPIYSEQHRFLPVLAKASGARIRELVVNHRSRRFGQSKYGMGRTLRVLIDLLSILMISTSSRRPLRYFAVLSLPLVLLGLVAVGTGITDLGPKGFASGRAQGVLLTGMLFSLSCVYFLALGLLAELVVKTSELHKRGSYQPLSSRR